MNHQTIIPHHLLKPYVRYFWTLEADFSDTTEKCFRTFADGCPGIIFQQKDKGRFYKNAEILPEAFLFGQSTRHGELDLSGNIRVIGIYFQPNALKTIFGLDAGNLTDSCMDLNLLIEKKSFGLADHLANSSSTCQQIEILSSYLFTQIEKNNSHDKAMQYGLSQIIQSKGTLNLKDLHKKLQLSERGFERRFKQYTGISPKLFSRICRFQSSLTQLRDNKFDKLSDIAFENDYSDQSHFIRAFKEFSGFSPNQFYKKSNEIVENFSEMLK